MSESPKVYQKDDSFIEVRQHTPDRLAVYSRIRNMRNRLSTLRLSTHHHQILERACADLLDEMPVGSDPRFMLQDYVIQEITRVQDDDLPRYLVYRYRYEMFPRL